MYRYVYIGLALAFASSALALGGCGSGSEGGPTLIVARVKDAINLDPAQSSDSMSHNVSQEIMKGLVQFKDGTFTIEPAIAQSWHVGSDGRTWTFVLNKGLVFSDGTPVDADAVKFNFDRWRLISSPYHANYRYPYYVSMFGGFPGLISDVRAPDKNTVVFELTHPYAPFLSDLAMGAFAIGSPHAIRNGLGDFASHPVGWGPYVFSEWVKGDHITLKANPNYPLQAAYKTVIVRDVADPATALNGMKNGDYDILTDPGPAGAAELAKVPGLSVYYQPANNIAYLAMNEERDIFDNGLVRQAIAQAIDVRSIVHQFYPHGAEVADNWVPPGMVGDNPRVKAYAYDPAKAKHLLAQAGYSNGFSTELLYSTAPRPYMPEPQRVAEAIQTDLKAVGITVALRSLDWSVFLPKTSNGEHSMAILGWTGDNGDPDNFLYTLLDQDSAKRPNALNAAFWRDPRFHQLMIAGQTATDPKERSRIYEEASQMVHDEAPVVPIVHVTVPVVVKSSISGFVPNPDTHIAFEALHP